MHADASEVAADAGHLGAEGPTARKRTLRKRFFPENAVSDRRIRRFSGFWRYYCCNDGVQSFLDVILVFDRLYCTQ